MPSPLIVTEIKDKLPEADVYELNPTGKYLIVVNRQSINVGAAQELLQFLPDALILSVDDPATAVRILEVSE